MPNGKLIVIEGTDGSGKTTQAKMLLRRLELMGYSTAYADFPQYGQKSAGMVENYLSGKYGGADDVDPRVASIFYAMDRYDAAIGIRKGLEDGRIIVCNRYVSANMGHQGGKIHDKAAREEYLRWLEDLEFNFFKIPKPDMTVLLYVPYKTAKTLVENKGYREYIGGVKKDIHEANMRHLIDAEHAFKEIAVDKGWNIIECAKGDGIMGIDEIHELVWSKVSEFLANSGVKPSRQERLNGKESE